MKRTAALLAALSIAACNSQGGNNVQGNGQAANAGQAPALVSIRPGLWETTTRIVSVDAPTAPPEAQAQLQAGASQPPTVERSCMTPAEAANMATALGERVARDQPGYDCQVGDAVFAGGRARLTLTCRSQAGGAEIRQAMAGTYTADTIQLAVSAEALTPATEQSPSIPIRIETTLTARRVGECTGNETN